MVIRYKKALFTILMACIGVVYGYSNPFPEPAGSHGAPDILLKFEQKFNINKEDIFSSPELKQTAANVDSVIKTDTVKYVDIRGFASIDGPVKWNIELAKGRAEAVKEWLLKSTKVDPSLIRITSNGEDWDMFEALVSADPNVPMKKEILTISTSNETIARKQAQLKSLGAGNVWAYLAKYILPEMRMAQVTIGGYRFRVKLEEVQPVEETKVTEVVEVVEVEETPVVDETPAEEPWVHKLYIKSNAPAWLMLWVNAAVEYDLAPHWSVALPIYYSGWNYFKGKLKFRTFAVVPEVRWWPRKDNMGFFINAHAGMNLFNYAKGGEWRYQTYKGHTPALGGGIGIGYRWYFCKNHRWSMEAGVGAGIYHLDYSIFENIPNGLIVGRKKRTFYGIDQASLSFAYSFGVKKRGGGK